MNYVLDVNTLHLLASVYKPTAEAVVQTYYQVEQKYGIQMRATWGLRTFAEQQMLYDQGRISPGKICTNAKPGRSSHNFGAAVDSCFRGSDPYLEKHPNGERIWLDFAAIAKSNGLVSGIDFPGLGDRDHLEANFGMNCDSMLTYYNAGGVESVWAEFDRRRGVQV